MDKVKQFFENVFGFTYSFINELWQLFMGFLYYVSHKSVKLGDVCMVAMVIVIMFCGFVTVSSDDKWIRCVAFCCSLLQTFAMGMLSADTLRTFRKE